MMPDLDIHICININCPKCYEINENTHRCKLLDKSCVYNKLSHNTCPIPKKCKFFSVMLLNSKEGILDDYKCSNQCLKKGKIF